MDTAKLWFTLLCVCGSWISSLGSLALKCDWTTEYEHEKDCCKACPLGEYHKGSCQEKCEKCPQNPSKKVKCVCDNHLCLNDICSSCEKRIICKPGKQLKRHGHFEYSFSCVDCPENTYNDAEGGRCKSITMCVGDVIFPGNKTHNARCASSGVRNDTAPDPSPKKQENGIQTHPLIVTCLIVTALTCFVFIMYTAFQIFKYKMLLKLRKPCTRALPSDTCSCKLSKEEMGDGSDSKSEVSEEYSKSVMSTAFLECSL